MSTRTIFDDIIDGTIPSWKVWEDEKHLAFLSPFGNTPGMTVVIPKHNPGAYIFAIDKTAAHDLIDAATTVAALLEAAFDVPKVAMVFEGEAVAHVHAKLYPMHGIGSDASSDSEAQPTFYDQYPGFITTRDGPRLRDEQLNNILKKIHEAAS